MNLRLHVPFNTAIVFLLLTLSGISAQAEVRVFIQESNGLAWIKHECTAGEVVRAFAIDVSVDAGRIVGISDFFRGESRAGSRGYGIFPASFRDHLTVTSGTNVNWDASGYDPLAVVADAPSGTLPGLDSYGVTLEFAALWDPAVPAAVPPSAGTLCALQLSEAAQVTVAANASRGGVVPASADASITTVFSGARVDPVILITGMELTDGVVHIYFKGGELEAATDVEGPWTGTGNFSGFFSEAVTGSVSRFYRVRRP